MTLTRRGFLGTTAAAGTALATPALAQAKPRVVVIGGGCGGATAARYIAKDSKGEIEVTLVEPQRRYYTCFFSNLAIWAGSGSLKRPAIPIRRWRRPTGSMSFMTWRSMWTRAARPSIWRRAGACQLRPLIMSPGIDFVENSVKGWSLADQDVMPHAYKGGTQAMLLKAQIEAMPEGGTYVMVAPPNPFRCPPGPYERISMVAHKLKNENPTAKIIIADPKPKFSKMGLFTEGWENHYSGMVEWLGPDFGGQQCHCESGNHGSRHRRRSRSRPMPATSSRRCARAGSRRAPV